MIRTLIVTALALAGVAHFASNASGPGSSLFAAAEPAGATSATAGR